jgi:Carboxypeptidase regulatory-like domain
MNPVICLILTLAALSPSPEITGTIVDYNGSLVASVPISVIALYANQTIEKTLSGSDGSFRFTDLAPGAYGLAAKTESGCAISDPIRVDIGFTTVVHLRLIKGLCQNPIAILQNRRPRDAASR